MCIELSMHSIFQLTYMRLTGRVCFNRELSKLMFTGAGASVVRGFLKFGHLYQKVVILYGEITDVKARGGGW